MLENCLLRALDNMPEILFYNNAAERDIANITLAR